MLRASAATEQLEIQTALDTPGPERIRVDDSSRTVVREVVRRDGRTVTTSTMGILSDHVLPSDLRAAADWLYVRRKTPPTFQGSGPAIRVVDLFSGCGGMSLGVAEACRALNVAFVPAGAFDIDQIALDVYARNFRLPPLKRADLGAILSNQLSRSAKKAERELIAATGKVDLVVAGPPCQGHSNLNNKTRRDDPKNELYFCVARFARLVEPQHLIVENVPTVLADKRKVVHRTEKALQKLGYTVRAGMVRTWELGVPQSRKRHLLVASRRPLPELNEMLARYRVAPRSLWWAISDLERVESPLAIDHSSMPTKVTQKRIDYLFDRDLYDLPDRMRPDCHRYKDHSYQAVYGRMYKEGLAPTITGGFDTMGRGRFVHPTQRRTITPHEAARLQGIPDFFDFSVVPRRTLLAELIGNAVPPKLSYAIALELLR
jgi:DNA (cytosine-5)-methyltransferase 1